MASSVIGILSTLGLSTDSTLEEILTKLVDYNLVTTDELHNIQNISVKPLPNIVRNQADILKQRMYGIATDEDYGLPIVINRRMVLIRYILDKLNSKLDTLMDELENGDFIVDKAKNDENGSNIKDTYETKLDANNKNSALNTKIDTLKSDLENGTIIVKKAYNDSANNNIAQTYETKADATTKNNTITQNVETLKTNLGNGAFVVKKAETDGANNVIHTTYETKLDANTKLNSAKSYTDTKLDELKRTLLGDNYDELYDTFKEISDYIASDKTFAQEILNKIETNQRNIATNTNNIENNSLRINNLNTTVSLKANSSEVYKKTETYSQQEIDKLFEDNNNIPFDADDSATIHESIIPLDNSTLIGKWVITQEDWMPIVSTYEKTPIIFEDSLGNEYTQIEISQRTTTTIDGNKVGKFSIIAYNKDGKSITIYDADSKTGLAYNEQGILKNNYHLIFKIHKAGVLRDLTYVANRVEFVTKVSTDKFQYNEYEVLTKKDLLTTTLIGNWKFKTATLNLTNYLNENVNFEDNLGNKYIGFIVKRGLDDDYQFIYATNTNYSETFICSPIRDYSRNIGLAANEDGSWNEDYYLIFKEENDAVLNVMKQCAYKIDLGEEQIATKNFVKKEISKLVDSAPETLDTLGELAQALEENDAVVEALNSSITKKVDKVEGKQLSTNDYTTREKEKLASLENYDDTDLVTRIRALEQSGGSGGSSLANQVFAVDEEGNRYEVYGVDKYGNKYLVTYMEVE